MRRALASVASFALLGLVAATVAGASQSIDLHAFRYQRSLSGAAGHPLLVKLDAPLLGHARVDLSDVRVIDAEGAQVPWRTVPEPVTPPPKSIPLIDTGWENGVLVTLLDLGTSRRVVNRIDLEIPGANFVGKVEVLGSDDRRSFRSLGRTLVYDLSGATHSRSTVITFRSSDLRYLELRAQGVPGITSATVRGKAAKRPGRVWTAKSIVRKERGRTTVVTLDLGYRLPVELLEVQAATPIYERPLEILDSLDGVSWTPLAEARLFRFEGASQEPIGLGGESRFLRLRIENGDDKPLGALRVRVLAHPPTLYVAGGAPTPYRLLYGARSRALGPPDYDLARLPRSALDLNRAVPAVLGSERALKSAHVAAPAKSLLDRYPWLIELTLGLVAVVLGVAGFVVFRSRA